MSDPDNTEDVLSPGSTATGSGTSMGEEGTTEADVTDGRDQKLPKADDDPSVS